MANKIPSNGVTARRHGERSKAERDGHEESSNKTTVKIITLCEYKSMPK